MGHQMSYFKPSLEELEQEYLKAVPSITTSESESLKVELQKKEEKHESEWTKMRLENLELRERLREHDEIIQQLSPLIKRMREERMKELDDMKLNE